MRRSEDVLAPVDPDAGREQVLRRTSRDERLRQEMPRTERPFEHEVQDLGIEQERVEQRVPPDELAGIRRSQRSTAHVHAYDGLAAL